MADIFGLLFPDARAGQLKNEETRNRILDNNRTRENVSGLQALLMGNAQTEATGNSPGNYVGPQSIDPNSLEGQQQMMGLLAGLPGGASAIAQGLLAPRSKGNPSRQEEKLALLRNSPEEYEALYGEKLDLTAQAELKTLLVELQLAEDKLNVGRDERSQDKKKARFVAGSSMAAFTEMLDLVDSIEAQTKGIGMPQSGYLEILAKVRAGGEEALGLDSEGTRQLVSNITRWDSLANNIALSDLSSMDNGSVAVLRAIQDGKFDLSNAASTNRLFAADGLDKLMYEMEKADGEVPERVRNRVKYIRANNGRKKARTVTNVIYDEGN